MMDKLYVCMYNSMYKLYSNHHTSERPNQPDYCMTTLSEIRNTHQVKSQSDSYSKLLGLNC